MTLWRDPSPVTVPDSFQSLGLPPLIEQILARRGFADHQAVRAYLDPDAQPPAPFPGTEHAVERIFAAIREKQPICIWGDFDVDGQTATALLVQALRALGAQVAYYIPVRGRESHGVHISSLTPLLDNGIRLMVTCDTGITAHQAVDYARSRGVDVIITDHYEPGETLPNAFAIINPKLLTEGHPLQNLAGVGVAYKFAEALLEKRANPMPPSDLLDLVALGLIADVALLQGETRALAQKGIQALRNTSRVGLKVLADLAGASLKTLTEDGIGFTFAPRLNALGRLSDANPAVEFLLTQDEARARVLALQIENLNSQRRLLTSQVFQAAEAHLRETPGVLNEPVILLSHPNWPGGVIGIVASKLVERYRKPVILLTETEDGLLRGSARSVEGVHITEAIAAGREYLLSFGGHPMAAGLALEKDKLAEFRRSLSQAVERQWGKAARQEPILQIDAWLNLNELSFDLADAIEKLAPFGAGNPPLTLATRNVELKSATPIGKTKEHLRLAISDQDGHTQSVLWWGGAGEQLPEEGQRFDIAYSLRASAFRGERQLTLQLLEYRLAAVPLIEIETSRIEMADWRAQPGQLPAEAQVFAEGKHKEVSGGRDRCQLTPAAELAVYTIPPGPAEWEEILQTVKPRKVYLLARPYEEEKVEEFIIRLSGLVKYALHRRGGKATIRELAAATAQREATVRLGLAWLDASGHLSVQQEDSQLHLASGSGHAEPYLQRELYTAIRGMLEETAAYRAYFCKAEKDRLV